MRKTKTIVIHLTPERYKTLQKKSKKAGTGISDYISKVIDWENLPEGFDAEQSLGEATRSDNSSGNEGGAGTAET